MTFVLLLFLLNFVGLLYYIQKTRNKAKEEDINESSGESNENKNIFKSEIIWKKKKYRRYPLANYYKHLQIEVDSNKISNNNRTSIPKNVPRKLLQQKRWDCISRVQSCGISSLVSVWNYLFSTRGCGALPVLSQEEALSILGFRPPFEDIIFGPITGNTTLITWFDKLNNHFGVQGQAFYFWKAFHSPFKPLHIVEQGLIQGLMKKDTAYIYHSMNHYSVPIGFEYSGLPLQAYNNEVIEKKDNVWDLWIHIGDTSKTSAPIRSIKLEHIAMDLWTIPPYHIDTRHIDHGLLKKIEEEKEDREEENEKKKKKKKNVSRPEHGHCIIGFVKSDLL